MNDDDPIQLRNRMADLDAAVDRGGQDGDLGQPMGVGGTTTTGTYPTVAGSFFAVTPFGASNVAEQEGNTAGFLTSAAVILCANVGGAVPPLGTKVLFFRVNNAFVFKYNG